MQRVAILGCGLIGARWDLGAPPDAPALTHAAAFSRHPGARIVGFCDADAAAAEAAAAGWQCGRAYGDAQALFAAEPVDIAVIAAASSVRLALVEAALAAGVRTLVIEKPLATTLAESRRIVQALDAAGAKALVNYLRHWDPTLAALREDLGRTEFGGLQRLVGLYGKGLSNNGSHMIDLAGLLARARPRSARALGTPLPEAEAGWSQGSDRALDAQVEYETAAGERLQLDLLATDMRAFSCFELKAIGRDAIAEVRLGGRIIERLGLVDDPDFAGYRVPGARCAQAGAALQAMQRMADEAVRLARGEQHTPSCDARSALATASTVEAIRQSARDGGAWITITD